MSHLISILFIIEFLLILNFLFSNLFKKGFTFKGGIAVGTLYFIYIPLWVMILKGKLAIFKADFGRTIVTDIVLKNEIGTSFILILYLLALIVYLYTPAFLLGKKPVKFDLTINLKSVVLVYIITLGVIFAGSGLLEGGNWYHHRNKFFKEAGSIAVLIAYIYNAAKILIMVAIIYSWDKGKI